MGEIWWVVLQGYFFLVMGQGVLWLIQNFTRDASTVDVGWALGMGFLVGWYAANFEGYGPRMGLLFLPMLLWSIRISHHLIVRMGHRLGEDARYADLRRQWGSRSPGMFFLVFQMQPVLNVVLSVPFLIAFLNPRSGLAGLELFAVLLWTLGFMGESAADRQLKVFLANSENAGKICREGWWRYSRHPNFFFEWVMWVAYFVFALASPGGVWAVVAPALMLFLLLKVTGIPPIEIRALATKGAEFRDYARETSIFVPWPWGRRKWRR